MSKERLWVKRKVDKEAVGKDEKLRKGKGDLRRKERKGSRRERMYTTLRSKQKKCDITQLLRRRGHCADHLF